MTTNKENLTPEINQNDEKFWSALATYKDALKAAKSLDESQRSWANMDAKNSLIEVFDKLNPGQEVEYHGNTDVRIVQLRTDNFDQVILGDSKGARWAEGIENLVPLKKELQFEANRDLNNTRAYNDVNNLESVNARANIEKTNDNHRHVNPYLQTRQAGTTLTQPRSQDNSALVRVASGTKKLRF